MKKCKCEMEPVEIVAILDRSGSMEKIRSDAIGGFNRFLRDQVEQPGRANMTIILFDTGYEILVNSRPVAAVDPLTNATFVPRGGTAMNDAIGRAIVALQSKAPERAIICILTDGEENASREFTSESVKQLITGCRSRGWEVIYLAANQDAFAVANRYGIAKSSATNFTYDSLGTQSAMRGMTMSVSSYRNFSDTDSLSQFVEKDKRDESAP